ncbi:MAG TPA: 23S rRNA (guanosine(2251)-2'-O)-methyltransferase RlmB [Lachnospiraceae bacterium]|nr:23S rRNA (guanosine(2251)-2'-O)-methyltransferase RlmB [Lachnospiraceae bacterium]
MITSENNAKIKELIKLQKNARHRRKEGLFVAEGIKLVQEAAQYGKLRQVLIRESLWHERWKDAPESEIAKELSVDGNRVGVDTAPDSVFDMVADTVTPQGILGMVDMPAYSLKEILALSSGLYLMLDDLRDPGNLGTVIRTAEAVGAAGVIMSRGCVDLFNPKVVRATMGAIFRVPFLYVESLPETIEQMKKKNISVYGTILEESQPYDEPDYTKPSGIVIGNEANGISAPVRESLTGRIHIPMQGSVESLNAAVAAAVVMYEASRQRRKRDTGLLKFH